MNKKTILKFNNNYFLLGIRKEDGEEVYLQDFKWDCGWYWGGGYLEVFNKNMTDINEHFHWDGLIKESNKNAFDAMNEYFSGLTLSERELWEFCDYMTTFYRLREVSEVFHQGNSHYTNTSVNITNKELCKKINEEYLEGKIIPAVRGLFEE